MKEKSDLVPSRPPSPAPGSSALDLEDSTGVGRKEFALGSPSIQPKIIVSKHSKKKQAAGTQWSQYCGGEQ